MKFLIDEKIFQSIPALKVGVIVLVGIDNSVCVDDFVSSEYASAAATIRTKFQDVELAEYPVVRGWRDIYKSFGEKKARSSVEALIKRVKNGNDLYKINPLVDMYNLASLKFELPCGGEDLSAMSDDLMLTFARGDEEFVPLGATEAERPNQGEIVYKFGNTIVCRNFNYRESDRTKLTADTKNAILVFEGISDCGNLRMAMEWIKEKVSQLLGADVVAEAILDHENRQLTW